MAAHARVVLVIGDEELDLGWVGTGQRCDLGLVDDLLRLQLATRRFGWTLCLVDVADELRELLDLLGLLEEVSRDCGSGEGSAR